MAEDEKNPEITNGDGDDQEQRLTASLDLGLDHVTLDLRHKPGKNGGTWRKWFVIVVSMGLFALVILSLIAKLLGWV